MGLRACKMQVAGLRLRACKSLGLAAYKGLGLRAQKDLGFRSEGLKRLMGLGLVR